jgi:hypothetical protein
VKTEEMRYLIICAAPFRNLATPSCSGGCSSQEIMTFPHKGQSSELPIRSAYYLVRRPRWGTYSSVLYH